ACALAASARVRVSVSATSRECTASCVRRNSARRSAMLLSLRPASARSSLTAWPCWTSVWRNWSCVAQPARMHRPAAASRPSGALRASVDDVGTAVLAVALFILAQGDGLLRAIADRGDAAAVRASQLERALHGLGPARAQREVVFAAAALVAVALHLGLQR